MKLLNKAVVAAKVRMGALAQTVTKKRDGGIEVIITLLLLVIAIGIAVTFKGAIEGWITQLTGYFEGQLNAFGVSGS
jgi:hypothetical protein